MAWLGAGGQHQLLQDLELAPAHVVGVSMGGMVGLQLAADTPEAVRSLVASIRCPRSSSAP